MARLSFCPPISTASKRPGVISAAGRQMLQKSRASPPLFKHLKQQTIRAESIKLVASHHRQIDLLPEPPFKPIPEVNGWRLLESAYTPALRSDRSWTC
jgi:hypothetical protein